MNNANECQAKSLDPTINTGDQLKIILGLKNLNVSFRNEINTETKNSRGFFIDPKRK